MRSIEQSSVEAASPAFAPTPVRQKNSVCNSATSVGWRELGRSSYQLPLQTGNGKMLDVSRKRAGVQVQRCLKLLTRVQGRQWSAGNCSGERSSQDEALRTVDAPRGRSCAPGRDHSSGANDRGNC